MALTDPREIESAAARIPVEGAFFDCVELEGHDLRRLPLTRRKECLRMLVPPLGPVHYVDHVMEHGDAFLEAAAEARLEGIVAKRASSAYTGGRSPDWIKVKCQRRGEFVIGGYTDPQGARGYFGALHIGLYDGGVSDAVRLVYVSKVGTGFDHAGLKSLWEKLQPLARVTPPFDGGAVPRAEDITGWSPGSSAKCASATGPTTGGSGTRPFSACGATRARRTAGARSPSCHPEMTLRRRSRPPPSPRRRQEGRAWRRR
jgi:ATP-dependent DNA ligase